MRGSSFAALGVVFVASVVGGFVLVNDGRVRAPRVAPHPAPPSAQPTAASTAAATLAPLRPETPAPSVRPAAPSAGPSAAPASPPAPRADLSGGARVAIIIDDCGQWPSIERALIALPIPLTMSIMPDVRYTDVIERATADAGQGVMLHLPMEPRSGVIAGAGEVTTAMDDAAIEAQVRSDLSAVPLARGVNNHEGSKATADARVMHAVASVLADEGRFFIDSRTTATTTAAKETQALGVPTASRNVFLDDVVTIPAVEAQLVRTADVARAHGTAIAIGHPKAATLAALRAAIPQMERDGITFVLASDLVETTSVASPLP